MEMIHLCPNTWGVEQVRGTKADMVSSFDYLLNAAKC